MFPRIGMVGSYGVPSPGAAAVATMPVPIRCPPDVTELSTESLSRPRRSQPISKGASHPPRHRTVTVVAVASCRQCLQPVPDSAAYLIDRGSDSNRPLTTPPRNLNA